MDDELEEIIMNYQAARWEMRLALKRLRDLIELTILPNKDYTPLQQLVSVGKDVE